MCAGERDLVADHLGELAATSYARSLGQGALARPGAVPAAALGTAPEELVG
jgi:hypothetical protein